MCIAADTLSHSTLYTHAHIHYTHIHTTHTYTLHTHTHYTIHTTQYTHYIHIHTCTYTHYVYTHYTHIHSYTHAHIHYTHIHTLHTHTHTLHYTHKTWNGVLEAMDSIQKRLHYIYKQVEDTLLHTIDQLIKDKRGAKRVSLLHQE